MPRRTNRIIDCGDYCKVELYYPHSSSVCDYALISKSDLTLVRQIYWRKTEYGYARGKNPLTRKDILLHKYITQTSKETVIDHINRNKLDCRRENMRIADSQINSLNRNVPCNSTTGYKGVSFDYRTGKFKAYVKVDRTDALTICTTFLRVTFLSFIDSFKSSNNFSVSILFSPFFKKGLKIIYLTFNPPIFS